MLGENYGVGLLALAGAILIWHRLNGWLSSSHRLERRRQRSYGPVKARGRKPIVMLSAKVTKS